MPLFELHRVATAIGLSVEQKTPQQIAAAILEEFAMLKDAAHPLRVLEGQALGVGVALVQELCGCGIPMAECDLGPQHAGRVDERAAAQKLWDEQRGVVPPAAPEHTEGENNANQTTSE